MLEEEAELVFGAVGMWKVWPHCHQQHLYWKFYIYTVYTFIYVIIFFNILGVYSYSLWPVSFRELTVIQCSVGS